MRDETAPVNGKTEAPTCKACGRPILVGSVVVEAQREDGGKDLIHEVCFLRASLANAESQARKFAGLLAGVVKSMGGQVRVHKSAIQDGIAAGSVSSKEEAGGWVGIWIGEEPRIVIASKVPPRPI